MCVFQHIHWVGFWHVSCFVSMFSGVYKCVDVMCIYIYTYIYMADILWLQQVCMSSRQNPLHLSSCYCYGYRFWGGPIAFQGFVENSIFVIQHEAKIHSWTGSEMDRAVVLLVSGASATLHVPFVLHSFACMFLHVPCICICLPFIVHSFLSCSFHVPFIGIHVHSFSFFLIPMCIHVLSCSFHLHACSFHFAFMSFHFLSKVEMALWLGQGTECNKGLSLSYR